MLSRVFISSCLSIFHEKRMETEEACYFQLVRYSDYFYKAVTKRTYLDKVTDVSIAQVHT